MFVYGTQYLRGATPERDQWEKDMKKMKELGFNTIRAWLVWNAIERQDGVIDEDYLNGFLSIAEKYDMKVGLLFHMHAAPAWAIDKYPQYFYVDEEGEYFVPSTRPNTPSGGWPGLCYDHDEVRMLEKRFIEKVISVTKKYSCVSFYEPMNEPHQWDNFLKGYEGSYCYCPATVKKYRKWLQEKYKTIEGLNDAWGMFYNNFDEVNPPRWLTGYCDAIDFRKFTMENVAKELEYRISIIKNCDNKPVIAHAFGGGMVTCANLGTMAFDDWKNAKVVDKWGCSAFPKSDEDCCMLGLAADSTRCAADGKEYWQSELGAGLIGTGLRQVGRINNKTFAKTAVETIRHGAKGLLYWQFRKERIGTEAGGFALSDYDGGDTNLTLEASRLCKAIKENEQVFENIVPSTAKVALIMSVGSVLFEWCGQNRTSNKFPVDSISGYYKMFWEENIPVDILHEEYMKDLKQYKLIIVPSPYAISQECADLLRKFVEDGGIVISDPYFGAYDGQYKLSRCVPGMDFKDVFGVEEDDFGMQGDLSLYKNDKEYNICGNLQRESFKNVTAEVLYTYDDKTPAITKNSYGKGYAIISGVNLGLAYSSRNLVSDDIKSKDKPNNSIDAKKIIFDICNEFCENPCNLKNVICNFGLGGNDCNYDILYVINNNKNEVSGKINCEREYKEAKLIYGVADVSLSGQFVDFSMGEDETIIIRLEK